MSQTCISVGATGDINTKYWSGNWKWRDALRHLGVEKSVWGCGVDWSDKRQFRVCWHAAVNTVMTLINTDCFQFYNYTGNTEMSHRSVMSAKNRQHLYGTRNNSMGQNWQGMVKGRRKFTSIYLRKACTRNIRTPIRNTCTFNTMTFKSCSEIAELGAANISFKLSYCYVRYLITPFQQKTKIEVKQ
jgi:hypothetical protein